MVFRFAAGGFFRHAGVNTGEVEVPVCSPRAQMQACRTQSGYVVGSFTSARDNAPPQ
jgi:hypothetical protein